MVTSAFALLAVSSLGFAQARKPPVALKPVKNTIMGRVTDSHGKPLAGVTVSIYGTTVAGENTQFEVETDAAGMYKQRIPNGIYGASAYYKRRYNGENYKFTLMPNDGTTAKKHDSLPGIVKSFTWKISGLKPGETPGKMGAYGEHSKYFGNSAQLSVREMGFDSFKFPAGSALEVTFTPTMPLIDGSTGKPIVRTFKFAEETRATNMYAVDIPVGVYSVTAAFIGADGTRQPLSMKAGLDFDGNPSEKLAAPFKPTQFGDLAQFQITLEQPKL